MGRRTSERSAACATCGKTFARSDTLLRHEKSHQTTEDRGPVHRVTNGTFRACSACAQARSRCSGGTPCGRCKTRNLECSYPNKRRKGADANDQEQPTFSVMNTPSDNTYRGQFQPLVFSPLTGSSYAASRQSELTSVTSAPSGPQDDHGQVRRQQHQQQRQQTDPTQPSPGTTGLPVTNVNMQHMPPDEATVQRMASVPSQLQNPEPYSNSPAQVDYHRAFDAEQQAFNSENLYGDTMSLNWIPLSIYPSPYGDMEQDFSFLLPPMSDAASMSNDFDALAFDSNMDMASNPGETRPRMMPPTAEYRPPASISGLMQSPASSNSDNIAPVGFTFDSVDIPDSRKKRRKFSQISSGFSQSQEKRTDFAFPDISALVSTAQPPRCSEIKYSQVMATFQRLCVNSSRWMPFSSPAFPSLSTFNACIDLYFEHLHPTFPLIHAPTFDRAADWLTCLATAAIGSTFAVVANHTDAREAFQEFLRRAVLATTDQHDGDFRNIHLAQARILALVGLAQADREQLRSRAPRSHADIARWCLESSILQLTAPDEEVRSDEDIEAAWDRWVQRESLRRVGYFIWLLDCALGYIGNARPLCNMDDARAPLPCSEMLWDASTAQEWLVNRNNSPPMPSLCAALETMYTKQKIDPDLSEISHVLLIHALYSRTWEVGTHIKQPLSEWKATGTAKGFLNTPSKDNFWLPLYPLYANWRNSACDCLDVLHWQAAATMAKNSGSEHHGILHLHLARVILLTPFQEIQDLLFFRINHRVSDLSKASFYVHDGSYQPRNPAKLPLIRKITWRWLREDQHKARLAMIHAGSVFWHVRRYSTNSFFEPLAIYLASIVLWTYGSYKKDALERDAAAAQSVGTYGTSTNLKHQRLHSQQDSRSRQIHLAPVNDSSIQPTRIEQAAQVYADSRSRFSRSHSLQNHNTTDGTSPIYPRSHPGTTPASISDTQSMPNHSPAPFISKQITPRDENDKVHPHATTTNNNNNTTNTTASSEDEDDNDDEDEDEDEDEDDQPSFIHLDRPCDDEIVQHFVRNGHNMSGYMSNVGDICQTPAKVLLEGAKILRTRLACWGVSREYHDILVRLADQEKDKSVKARRDRR